MDRRNRRRALRAAGKKGASSWWAKVATAKQPKEPLDWSLLELADRAGFTGPTWARWRVWLKVSAGLTLDPEGMASRSSPPSGDKTQPVPLRRGGQLGDKLPMRDRQACGNFKRANDGGGSGLVVRLVFKTSWGPLGPR